MLKNEPDAPVVKGEYADAYWKSHLIAGGSKRLTARIASALDLISERFAVAVRGLYFARVRVEARLRRLDELRLVDNRLNDTRGMITFFKTEIINVDHHAAEVAG